MRRSMGSCSISRRPRERRSWRRGDSNGRVRAEICRRARAGASTGGLGGLGEGTTRPLFLTGLPDLFRQSERGGDGAAGRPEEAEPGKISDLQPAIRDADPRGPADSEGTGPAGGPVDGSETGTAREGGARRRAQRNAALGSLPRAGSLSQNLRHLGDGGRKERQPDGSDGPVRELPEDFAGGPEKGGGVTHVPVHPGGAGGAVDGVSGDVRGSEVRHVVRQLPRGSAGADAIPDRARERGAGVHCGLRGATGGGNRGVPVVGAEGIGSN